MINTSVTERVLKVAGIAAAFAMLLRVGGYGEGWLPSALLCLLVLVLLASVSSALRLSAADEPNGALRRMGAWAREQWFWLGLAAVVVFALAVRMFGIGDAVGHMDVGIDQRRLTMSVWDFLATGEIGHRTVEHYPGIHFWFLAASFLFTYLWALMAGLGSTLNAMPVAIFVRSGQAVSAFQGAATVLLTGVLGYRLAGRRVGLLAAGLMAISPLSIELSRQVRNDAAQVMLVAAAVVMALGVHRSGRGLEAALAGVLGGLATGVKYSSLFVAIPIFLAAATSEEKERRGPSLALAVAGFVSALAVSNHFLWADIPNFIRQLSDQIGITDEAHWAAQTSPAAFHVSVLARRVVGWPLMVAAVGIAAFRLGSVKWRWWLFLSFPLTYIWFVAQRPSQFPRWVYPSAPFVAVVGSAGLFAIVAFAVDRTLGADPRARSRRAAVSLTLALLMLSPILWSWALQTSRRLTPPTYSLIETWLEEEVPRGDRLLIERQWLDIRRPRFRPHRVHNLGEALDGGIYQLADHDWIIVHEAWLAHPALENLELVRRFVVDNSFGGNVGPDFAVYRPRQLEPLRLPVSASFDEPDGAAFLGLEWTPDKTGRPGLVLPGDGASLFIPPLERVGALLEIIMWIDRPPPEEGLSRGGLSTLVIEAELAGERLALEQRMGERDGVLIASTELSGLSWVSGISRVAIRPSADADVIRVLGLRLR